MFPTPPGTSVAWAGLFAARYELFVPRSITALYTPLGNADRMTDASARNR